MRRLEWDSGFWNVDVWEIEVADSFYDSGVMDIGPACRGRYLIQVLVPITEIHKIGLLEKAGFSFAESKITLRKPVKDMSVTDTGNIRKVEKSEIEHYKDIFYGMYGNVSRYELFPPEKINEFYCTWVSKSIDGILDDTCVGYYDDGHLAGFITYKCRDNKAVVGLIGVFPQFQKKGISQKLLGYLNNDAMHAGLDEIVISTQGVNLKAINSFIKSGFLFDSIQHWYYLKNW